MSSITRFFAPFMRRKEAEAPKESSEVKAPLENDPRLMDLPPSDNDKTWIRTPGGWREYGYGWPGRGDS